MIYVTNPTKSLISIEREVNSMSDTNQPVITDRGTIRMAIIIS